MWKTYYKKLLCFWLCCWTIQAVSGFVQQQNSKNLCQDSRCLCDSLRESSINITCRCSPQDKEATFRVTADLVPQEVATLVVSGCREVAFHSHAFKGRSHLKDIKISDVGTVEFQPHSIGSLNGHKHPIISVSRCRELNIRGSAFANNVERPLSFSADNCQSVSVEGSAFSRIHKISFYAVLHLHLASDAFRFTTAADDESMLQGDVTIEQCHLAGDLKSFTFPSPLSQLRLNNVSVETIQPNATSAVRILHLHIFDSSIKTIADQAFSELTHLDAVEIRNSRVGVISRRAVRSAVSSFVLSENQVGSLEEDGLSVTAATVLIRNNHFKIMKTGALNLREWNNLLIENNTMDVVERHAFFRIGEPKLEYSHSNVRFVIKSNTVHQAESGAFIFSAKASRLQLTDNYFRHNCECNMESWAADLTRVTRRTFAASETLSTDSTDALWLGTTLYNSSYCQLSRAESECRNIAHTFLPMSNYSEAFCPRSRQYADCIRSKETVEVTDRTVSLSGITISRYNENISPLYVIIDQNLLLVVVLAVAVAVALGGVFCGIFLTRNKKKPRLEPTNKHESDELVTHTPLLPSIDKQLGSGVVASGSISRLSVKKYRDYLEDSGPIYSEPLDPPYSKSSDDLRVDIVPPEIPAFPPEWTPKLANNIHHQEKAADEYPGSVADEFAADIFTALQDKMDLSPTYAEVKDAIENSTKDPQREAAKKVKTFAELYDSIDVIENKPRPSTSSALSEHIYCKPWTGRESLESGDSGLSPSIRDSPFTDGDVFAPLKEETPEKSENPSQDEQTDSPSLAKKAEVSNLPPWNNKAPLCIPGSVPKWPPAPKNDPPSSCFSAGRSYKAATPLKYNTSSKIPVAASNSFRGAKPPLRHSVQRSHSSASPTPRWGSSRPMESNRLTHNTPVSLKKDLGVAPALLEEYANPKDEAFQASPTEVDIPNEEYCEVASVPPVLTSVKTIQLPSPSCNDPSGDPPQLCEYADPRDKTEHLYTELQNMQ